MPKIKVLPVYPGFPWTFWGFQGAMPYLKGKKANMPPTGLATVLAMLPESFEPQRIIDLNIEPLTDTQIKASDIVFTSSMAIQAASHDEVVRRAHFFGKKVVAGGPFPTSYPERNKEADFLVTGEAEITLAPFLEDLLRGQPQRVYTESEVLKSGRVKGLVNGKPSLVHTPPPRWDLVSLDKYVSPAIQYSRGCPFNCEFCDITELFGRFPRTKTPSQMIKEIEAIYRTGHRGFVFLVDDNFIGNAKNVRQLMPELIKWQQSHSYPFDFCTEASLNLAWNSNTSLLEDMVRAGFTQVFLGIESVDNDTLKSMNKNQNTAMSPLEAVRKIQKAGIEVTGGFIIGSDAEKSSVFDDLFRFIQESGIVLPMLGLLTALKGTQLYARLKQEGRLKYETDGNNTHHIGLNFVPRLDEKFLIEGYVSLLEKLFTPKNYYERCRTLQGILEKKPEVRRKIHEREVLAFFKSLATRLPARGGIEYAKYMIETALYQPRHFSDAVSKAIKLVHFEGMTKATSDAYHYQETTDSLYTAFERKIKEIYHNVMSAPKNAREKMQEYEGIVRKKADRLVSWAEKRYSRLHGDFKADARKALDNLKSRVQSLIATLQLEYSPTQ